MKIEDIKKKLFFESSVLATALVLAAAMSYFLSIALDDYNEEKTHLESELSAVKQSKSILETKYQKVQKNSKLYVEIAEKHAAEMLSISRSGLRKKVNEFRTRYFLNEFSLSMSPVQDMKGEKYNYKFSTISSSELTANFDAVSDEDIYSLTRALEEELPGSIRIIQFKLSRVSKVTDESLRTIAKSGRYSMVKGDMKFVWFGIKPAESASDTEGKK